MKKILAVPLLGLWLFMPVATLGSAIGPGFDLFGTPDNGKTYVELPGVGKVLLMGNPVRFASSVDLGKIDTIVERKEGINPFDFPDGVGTVKIELVALSLKSIKPISIDVSELPQEATRYVKGYVGRADLYVTVNALGLADIPQPDALAASTGSMTIHHQDNPDRFSSQGKFTSDLSVYANVIFVKADTKIGDTGSWLASMPAPDTVKLDGKGIWTHHKPLGDVHNAKYPAGDFYITDIEHVGPHKPKPIIQLPSPGCGPGKHWVDKCPAGIDGAHSTAVVTIKSAPCSVDGPSQKVILGGPTVIKRQAGVPHTIKTEMVSMVLRGGGGITLRAGVNEGVLLPTLGKIVEETDPRLAKASFEVYFEIDGTPLGTLHNDKPHPHHMEAIIDRVPPLGVWHFPIEGAPPMTPLFDKNGKEVACLENSKHKLNRPHTVEEIKTVYCVHDDDLNDSQFCYGEPTPLVNTLGPLYENCDIESLDIMHSTDDLYAAAGDNTPRKSHLYYVYKHNGDVVDLGDIGGPDSLREIDALSFHPLTDDLWGWAQGEGLFKITVLPFPKPTSLFPKTSPFTAVPPFPKAIPIQPVVNIKQPVCKKPTSKVPTIPAEVVFKGGIEIEDITWNQRGDVLYGVENLHTDSVDSHGEVEDEWPYNPVHPDIDYDEGIKLWAYRYDTGKYKVVCPNLAPSIKKVLGGNEAEIEGLESLPNDSTTEDLIVVSFHGPKVIYYAGIIVQPWGAKKPQCDIWIAKDRTDFNDIEGMAASPFRKPSKAPPGYPHYW